MGEQNKIKTKPPPSGRGPGPSNQSTGSCQGKCPGELNKGVIVYCEHDQSKEVKLKRRYDQPNQRLDVVQDRHVDVVTIFSEDPNSPAELKVQRLDDLATTTITGQPFKRGKKYIFEASYHPQASPYTSGSGIFQSLITYHSKPTEYIILGLPSLIFIYAHNPDQWKLSLKFPPFHGYKVGRKLDNTESTKVDFTKKVPVETTTLKNYYKETEKKHWNTKETIEVKKSYEEYCGKYSSPYLWTYGGKGESVHTKQEEKKKKAGSEILKSIELQRNNSDFIPQSIDFVLALIALGIHLEDMHKKFVDAVPKIGWYLDFEFSIFQGKCELAWGWREHTDWRTYYYLGAAAKMTLLDFKLEAGFGVDVPGFKAQVCVQVKGSIDLVFGPLETTGPTEGSYPLGGIDGDFKFGGYARVEVGYFFNIEGGLVGGWKFTGEATLSETKEFRIKGDLNSAGLKATYQYGSHGWGEHKGEATLYKPSKGRSYEFPAPAPKPRPELSDSEVSDQILHQLEGDFWHGKNKVTDYRGEGQDEDVPLKEVADMFTKRILKHRENILLDPTTVEGIGHSIQKKLDGLASKAMMNAMRARSDDSVAQKIFAPAIEWKGAPLNEVAGYAAGEFIQVLKDAEDPIKKLAKI